MPGTSETLHTIAFPDTDTNTLTLAEHIYRVADQKNYTNGYGTTAVRAAAIYLAERVNGTPRTLQELADRTGIDVKSIGRAMSNVQRGLGLELPPESPTNYVPKICDRVELPEGTEQNATELLEAVQAETPLNGSPNAIAGAAVYTAAKPHVRQIDVADAADVRTATIRNWMYQFDDADVDVTAYTVTPAPEA